MSTQPASDTHDIHGKTIDELIALGLIPPNIEWIEYANGGWAHYWIGGELSAWACPDCARFGGHPDEHGADGCPHCGYGAYAEPEETA